MSDNQFKDELDKFSYALGLSTASNLIQSGVETMNPQFFMEALGDVYSGKKPRISPDSANQILQNFMSSQMEGESAANLEAGLMFLSENREKEGIVETASGLQYKILVDGHGESPSPADQVKCHYHGTLIDGTVFDSSVQRGKPAVFPVNGVIQGWVEALQMMRVGSKWRLFIPSDLAYGEQGAGGVIGPNSTLIFDVELLEILN